MSKRYWLLAIVLLAIGLILAACGQQAEQPPTPAATPTPQECPEVTCPTPEPTTCPEPEPCPTAEPVSCPEPEPCPEPVVAEVPFAEEWLGSGHNNKEAEAFNHWNEDDPAVIPPACAKCHSTPGYLDFLGADGTAAGTVDKEAPIGTTITCVACHNEVTIHKDSVVFPSGVEITGLGDESRCMECHQGRHSTVSVNAAIEKAGVAEDVDKVSEDLGFANIHYFAAAATQYGTLVKGGYEYEGKSYDARFFHVEGYNTCIDCHDSHTLEIKLEKCTTCHKNVASREDLVNIRMRGSEADYDGDGDTTEGIMSEIKGLQEMLYGAIQAYAAEVAGTPIVYDPHNYPYFFIDTDGNGEVSEGEAAYPNRYNAWTARLLKAAYNYQVSMKDPGEFAHGGKYIIQLLYDSIEDLNQAIAEPVDLSAAHRIDPGHFAGSQEAFRHWDEEGEIPGRCSKCHSADGLPFYLKEGVTVSQPPANGFKCTTCHENLSDFSRYSVDQVEFPSGAVLALEDPDSNLCINCHQGRESTGSVNKLIAGIGEDTVTEGKLRFLNVHYFAAGATLFGTEAKGAYEYEGNTYLGRNNHVPGFQNCTDCHETHALEVKTESCATCHSVAAEDVRAIRMSTTDYDGDGDTTEGIAGEIETYREKLYAAIQAYAAEVVGTPIFYEPQRYPYFFTDTNANGQADPDEVDYGNRYNAWTPRLLKAAYNYQYATKDPGGFAHNGKYVLQILYDSLADMSQKVEVDMAGMIRP